MAIDRLRSPFNNMLTVKGDVGPAAYSNAQTNGLTPFNFVGDGSTNTIVGVTYRCHVFEYVSGQSPNITFNRAGAIDVLVCGGGAAGGGVYSLSGASIGYSGGGGGGGGLILSYGYGVSASTYNITVGKKAIGIAGASGVANDHQDSSFGTLTAVRGGAGGPAWSTYSPASGGSGGGGGSGSVSPFVVTSGTVGQGNNGGERGPSSNGGGGGGGYVSAGLAGGVPSARFAGDGGDGITLKFDNVLRGFSAGGGGGCWTTGTAGVGGIGGGGSGTTGYSNGGDATGYGCGGGGASAAAVSQNPIGGDGSDGLVIIRYALG